MSVMIHQILFGFSALMWPNTALEPTGVGAASSASRSKSSVAGGSAFGR